MSNKLSPARITKPGDIISRELQARNMSIADLAELTDTHFDFIKQIINGDRAIDINLAQELSVVFGISVIFWINLQQNYERHLGEKMQ